MNLLKTWKSANGSCEGAVVGQKCIFRFILARNNSLVFSELALDVLLCHFGVAGPFGKISPKETLFSQTRSGRRYLGFGVGGCSGCCCCLHNLPQLWQGY